jgi:hypothetical protein
MALIRRLASWLVIIIAILWFSVIAVALGSIYLRRDVPWHSLSEWAISVQIGGTDDSPPFSRHTSGFYQARFILTTAAIAALGLVGYRYIRKK